MDNKPALAFEFRLCEHLVARAIKGAFRVTKKRLLQAPLRSLRKRVRQKWSDNACYTVARALKPINRHLLSYSRLLGLARRRMHAERLRRQSELH